MAYLLSGFFCSGKSTLGKMLASFLQLPFYDTDRMMEALLGKPVSVIWKEEGEKKFREMETEAIKTFSSKPSVIALGGGTFLKEENQKMIRKLGAVFYLKSSISLLFERACKRGLPAFLDCSRPFENFKEIFESRVPIYEKYCDHVVEIENFTSKELLDRILSLLYEK